MAVLSLKASIILPLENMLICGKGEGLARRFDVTTLVMKCIRAAVLIGSS